MDGWNTTFLLGFGLFSGAFAVSFREGIMAFVLPPRLHEICEGHRLLTLRGRGSELQAVSGLKTKFPQIFFSGGLFSCNKKQALRWMSRFFCFFLGGFKHHPKRA